MRKSMAAAIAVLVAVVSFSFAIEAQTRRKPVRKARAKPVAAKPAVLPSGAVRTASGLTYLITHKGTGRIPKAGETIIYHYMGLFTNGVKFDSSYDDNRPPFAFSLGGGDVIKGAEEGMSKLRVGDRAIMVLPPEIAYGATGTGNGDIPPNSTLVFVVEVLDVKGPSLGKHLYRDGKSSGPEMVARYRELKKSGFGDMWVDEGDLNLLGYRLLRGKQVDSAIEIFKLIVEEYPASANPYDSLGEAYVAAGQKELAIESYEKALKIDPKLPSSLAALAKLRPSQ